MNKINKKLLLSLLITILTQKNEFINASIEKSTELQQTVTQELKKEQIKEKPQPLVCAEMDLLNKLLILKPVNILRMKSSYKTASDILKTINEQREKIKNAILTTKNTNAYVNNYENVKENEIETTKLLDNQVINALTKEEVIEKRDKLLKPVESFFINLYDYQNLLKPLVVKILIGDDLIKDKTNDYLFLQFFDVPKKEANTFFKNTLVTEEKLEQACKEFDILFGVVTVSLSDDVIKKEQELLEKIRARKPVRKK